MASPVMQPAHVISRDSAAVIDRNTELTGNLHSKGNILIEGKFQGDIEANETVVIDQEADAKGHVSANEVIVSGTFDGEIVCRHRTQITSSASIKGEIKTPILVIEEGSTVDCRFEMSREGR
jgi:cytoskeletal protein CcmA (bactofilin family)